MTPQGKLSLPLLYEYEEEVSYKLLTEFEDKLPLTAKEVYGKVGKSVKTKQKEVNYYEHLLLLLLLIKGCV